MSQRPRFRPKSLFKADTPITILKKLGQHWRAQSFAAEKTQRKKGSRGNRTPPSVMARVRMEILSLVPIKGSSFPATLISTSLGTLYFTLKTGISEEVRGAIEEDERKKKKGSADTKKEMNLKLRRQSDKKTKRNRL
ncbi:unnamed protein product [Ilex paraguariensis]|uniref:Uncharacterized protein n=1 Tax=Ilex paraguariensis TaxID=185542 RepID=A0ABC8RKX3_9AQUA